MPFKRRSSFHSWNLMITLSLSWWGCSSKYGCILWRWCWWWLGRVARAKKKSFKQHVFGLERKGPENINKLCLMEILRPILKVSVNPKSKHICGKGLTGRFRSTSSTDIKQMWHKRTKEREKEKRKKKKPGKHLLLHLFHWSFRKLMWSLWRNLFRACCFCWPYAAKQWVYTPFQRIFVVEAVHYLRRKTADALRKRCYNTRVFSASAAALLNELV